MLLRHGDIVLADTGNDCAAARLRIYAPVREAAEAGVVAGVHLVRDLRLPLRVGAVEEVLRDLPEPLELLLPPIRLDQHVELVLALGRVVGRTGSNDHRRDAHRLGVGLRDRRDPLHPGVGHLLRGDALRLGCFGLLPDGLLPRGSHRWAEVLAVAVLFLHALAAIGIATSAGVRSRAAHARPRARGPGPFTALHAPDACVRQAARRLRRHRCLLLLLLRCDPLVLRHHEPVR
eukprot:scaffold104667_cov72-Phaeocystis_antarctica.AAC.6